jgi:hypothetical protein
MMGGGISLWGVGFGYWVQWGWRSWLVSGCYDILSKVEALKSELLVLIHFDEETWILLGD